MNEFREHPGFSVPDVLKENDCPTHWSRDIALKWSGQIPEGVLEKRLETPIKIIDLWADGFGEVKVKDESRQDINPTGTIKDRMALACAEDCANYARFLLDQLKYGRMSAQELDKKPIYRYSILTAGNAGTALAEAFDRFDLLPPKLLLDSHLTTKARNFFKTIRADVYLADLSTNPFSGKPSISDPLTPSQILKLTNNYTLGGVEITSSGTINTASAVWVRAPWRKFYRNLAKDIFAKKPNEVYVPYGSGVLFDNVVDYQYQRIAELRAGKHSKARNRELTTLSKVKIFGAEPESLNTIADKLSAPAKPFKHYTPKGLEELKGWQMTPVETGVYKVSEDSILAAYELLKARGAALGIQTEPSAAAGLALYIQRWKENMRDSEQNVIIVNTGHGLFTKNTL
ncbi:MAG: pyridoxal-phosphate dependent enzyme [Candidatus Doudnabacteria bacterium]|nr:pyridoxal-phosphate dependent enzyme [Candidatus Doudnabacteria bacterium]